MKKRNITFLIIAVIVLLIILGVGIFTNKTILLDALGINTPTLGIGSKMVSSIDGMTMLYIPAGEFYMGYQDYDSSNPMFNMQFP